MKKMLLPILALVSFTTASLAQSKTYAITSEKQGESQWTAIREIDFSTSEFTKTIFSKTPNQVLQFRGINGSAVDNNNFITGRGVAAAAFDKVNNRLYFSEMYGNDLKYIDFKSSTTNTLSVSVNSDNQFNTGAKKYDESNVITRMAFSNDGTGYALTNDGNNLIKFTTAANASVINLGTIKDHPKNKNVSIHSQCTSWGGDLIGDIYGNLYLISMRNNVFKISINKMEAEFLGNIKNLPNTFTTNGAAADDDGNILISSASNASSYFKVNPSTLDATIIKGGKEMYNVSDLANSNLIYQRKTTGTTNLVTAVAGDVSVYPNPTINKNFTVNFNKLNAGNYSLILTDINGKSVLNKMVNINAASVENVSIPKSFGSGIYMLRVVDKEGKSVYTNRIVVE